MGWQGIAQTLAQLEICTSLDPPGLLQKRDYKVIRYRYFEVTQETYFSGCMMPFSPAGSLSCLRTGLESIIYIFVSWHSIWSAPYDVFNLTNQISEYRSCEPHPPFENNEHHWIWLSLEFTVVFKPTGAVWVLWRAQMVFSEEIDQAMCLQGRCLDGTKTDPKHLTLEFWLALKAS